MSEKIIISLVVIADERLEYLKNCISSVVESLSRVVQKKAIQLLFVGCKSLSEFESFLGKVNIVIEHGFTYVQVGSKNRSILRVSLISYHGLPHILL